MKIIPKVWGWEVVLVSNKLYSCKVMVIKGGYQCSIHYHKLKDETFVLLAGQVSLETGNTGYIMDPFSEYHIARGRKHRFKGAAGLSFVLEVATQDLPGDSYRETKSGKIDTTL